MSESAESDNKAVRSESVLE
jgi:hypothetical protein